MKTKIIFIITAFVILIVSCTWKNDNGKNVKPGGKSPSIANLFNPSDTAILILSIPDWALGQLLKSSPAQACQNPDSLRALRIFDDSLHHALVQNVNIGKYQLTHKINPCCPCGSGGTTCCQCDPSETVLASPSTMHATVKYNSIPVTPTTKDGVDLFTLSAEKTTLEIDGKGITTPLTLNMN